MVSNNKKEIKLKPIIIMLILQILLSFLLLNTEFGLVIIRGVSSLFDRITFMYWAIPINTEIKKNPLRKEFHTPKWIFTICLFIMQKSTLKSL
jgi:hypothetical protein